MSTAVVLLQIIKIEGNLPESLEFSPLLSPLRTGVTCTWLPLAKGVQGYNFPSPRHIVRSVLAACAREPACYVALELQLL